MILYLVYIGGLPGVDKIEWIVKIWATFIYRKSNGTAAAAAVPVAAFFYIPSTKDKW